MEPGGPTFGFALQRPRQRRRCRRPSVLASPCRAARQVGCSGIASQTRVALTTQRVGVAPAGDTSIWESLGLRVEATLPTWLTAASWWGQGTHQGKGTHLGASGDPLANWNLKHSGTVTLA